jgi:hypothetical protein
LIDRYLDEFPLMVDVWEEMFGIDIEESPQIGLVDLSEVREYFYLVNFNDHVVF